MKLNVEHCFERIMPDLVLALDDIQVGLHKRNCHLLFSFVKPVPHVDDFLSSASSIPGQVGVIPKIYRSCRRGIQEPIPNPSP